MGVWNSGDWLLPNLSQRRKPQFGHERLTEGHPLNKGLVGCWLMNEGAGNTIYDLSGKGNHGALTNGPTWVGEKFGTALSFDGTNDYVIVPDADSLSFGNGTTDIPFSLSFWLKVNSLSGNRWLINKRSSGAAEYQLVLLGSGSFEMDIFSGGSSGTYISTTTNTSIGVGAWKHVVFTYNGNGSTSGCSWYINGISSTYSSSTAGSYVAMSNTAAPLYMATFGPSPGAYLLNGYLDNIRAYKSELRSAEVLELYVDNLVGIEVLDLNIWAPVAGVGAQDLTPSLVTNTNSFYAATVATGTVSLTPGLFTNSNSFYSPIVAVGAVDLTPGFLTNTNSFYSPSISAGTVNLTPSLFTNSNSFYSHVVSLASGPQTLLPSLFSNSNSFYSASVITGSVDLTPLLFTDSNSFYSPIVSLGGVSLLPSLLSNTNSFYAPTVSPGLVNLVASLFTNSNTFYGHTVAQPSLQDLTPSLYSNPQAFYTHTISAGTTLSTADLLAIADAVWAHPEALTVAKFLGLK